MRAVLIINGSSIQATNSVKEAVTTASNRYRNTCWQEREDLIEVRNLVIEPNGYQHTGESILFKCSSSKFWAK